MTTNQNRIIKYSSPFCQLALLPGIVLLLASSGKTKLVKSSVFLNKTNPIAINATDTSRLEIQIKNITKDRVSAEIAPVLAGDVLYIGIDNLLQVTSTVPVKDIGVSHDLGSVTKFGDKLIVRVTNVMNDFPLKFYIRTSSGELITREFKFPVRAIPAFHQQQVTNVQKKLEITLEDLKKISLRELLGVSDKVGLISWRVTIDLPSGGLQSLNRFDNAEKYDEAVLELIGTAWPGRTLTFDNVKGIEDSLVKRLPSRVWHIVK